MFFSVKPDDLPSSPAITGTDYTATPTCSRDSTPVLRSITSTPNSRENYLTPEPNCPDSQQENKVGTRRLQSAAQGKCSSAGFLPPECTGETSSMGSEFDEADNEVKWFTDLAFRSLSSPQVDYLDVYNSSHRSSTDVSQPSTVDSPGAVAWMTYADLHGSALPENDWSFECVDVALESKEESSRGKRTVPKRQIQLLRRNTDESKYKGNTENIWNSPSTHRCSKDTLVRQHSTPAFVQKEVSNEVPDSPQNDRKKTLQKSVSLDDGSPKTQMEAKPMLAPPQVDDKMQNCKSDGKEGGGSNLEEKYNGDSANPSIRNTSPAVATPVISMPSRMTSRDIKKRQMTPENQEQLAGKSVFMSKTPEITLKPSSIKGKKTSSLKVSLSPDLEQSREMSESQTMEKATDISTRSTKVTETKDNDDSNKKSVIHRVRDVRKLVKNTYNLSFKASNSTSTAEDMVIQEKREKPPQTPPALQIECKAISWKDKQTSGSKAIHCHGEKQPVDTSKISQPWVCAETRRDADITVTTSKVSSPKTESQHKLPYSNSTTTDGLPETESITKRSYIHCDQSSKMPPRPPSKEREVSALVVLPDCTSKTTVLDSTHTKAATCPVSNSQSYGDDQPPTSGLHADRRPANHPSPQAAGPAPYHEYSHSANMSTVDPRPQLFNPQDLPPSFGNDYANEGPGGAGVLYPENVSGLNCGQGSRRVLLDPETGKYFYIEVPMQPLRKMLFDPELGQYVEVLIPQQAMSHSGLYPPAAPPYSSLHSPGLYAPQYLPYAVPSNQIYLESMYYIPTGMNASPNSAPSDCYHKPSSMPPSGGRRA
uniref:Uncharacterized LOC107680925 n=1 Tax=Sinocyclocheilus anshuiensis TaxID=1608454 RepID=A0A671LMQ5_9TELE